MITLQTKLKTTLRQWLKQKGIRILKMVKCCRKKHVLNSGTYAWDIKKEWNKIRIVKWMNNGLRDDL